jgi:pyruvate/2-oxoglutarate dehydrogenase complex dihydrolipoamide dehydrogenase (E3) component
MSYDYHVIVVGSGSGGKEACLKAAQAGLRTLLVEEHALGGTTFHRGSYAICALRACATYLKRTEEKSKTRWTDWRTAYDRTSNRLIFELSQAIDQDKVDPI